MFITLVTKTNNHTTDMLDVYSKPKYMLLAMVNEISSSITDTVNTVLLLCGKKYNLMMVRRPVPSIRQGRH